MPVAATAHTAAGAVAFATFFIRTIDWGYATTNSRYMSHYFEANCVECQNTKTLLDNAARQGDHYLGSRLDIVNAVLDGTAGSSDAEFAISVDLNISSVEIIDKNGNAKSADTAVSSYREVVSVAWRRSGWVVVSIHGSPR